MTLGRRLVVDWEVGHRPAVAGTGVYLAPMRDVGIGQRALEPFGHLRRIARILIRAGDIDETLHPGGEQMWARGQVRGKIAGMEACRRRDPVRIGSGHGQRDRPAHAIAGGPDPVAENVRTAFEIGEE